MDVVAKFWCCSNVRVSEESSAQLIRLAPVIGGSPENDSFFDATPSGAIELVTTGEAANAFILGKEYYVTFAPAEQPNYTTLSADSGVV